MPQTDELLDRLLQATVRLLEAAERQEGDAVESAVSERQLLIDELSAFLPLDTGDPKIEALAKEILDKDRLAQAAMQSYFDKVKKEVSDSSRKFEGMKQYFNSRYDLTSGQIFDRRR